MTISLQTFLQNLTILKFKLTASLLNITDLLRAFWEIFIYFTYYLWKILVHLLLCLVQPIINCLRRVPHIMDYHAYKFILAFQFTLHFIYLLFLDFYCLTHLNKLFFYGLVRHIFLRFSNRTWILIFKIYMIMNFFKTYLRAYLIITIISILLISLTSYKVRIFTIRVWFFPKSSFYLLYH